MDSGSLANAKQIVLAQLSYETEILALQKQLATETGHDLTEATVQEINEFLNMSEASDIAKQSIAQLALESMDFANMDLSTDSKIDELINLANAAEEILKNHIYSVWFNEKENVWYTCLPDDSKPDKRRRIKRKNKIDLEKAIVDFYKELENNQKKEKEEILTVEKLFYEFMKHKSKEVGSGTVKRMMIDWRRFYKPESEFLNKAVKTLTKIDIDDFFNTVLDKHLLKKKGFYNMCGILKQMLEYAVDAEYIEKSPYRIKVNKKKFAPDKKLSEKEVYKTNERELLIEEMERRLKNNPSNTAPLAVLLDFELGTRKGEIKELLGHADETTTLKHYIFNIEDDSETANIVLGALEGNKTTEEVSCEQCEQNVVSFSDMKKALKPLKIKDLRA